MRHLLRVLGVSVFVLFFALPVAYAAYGEAPTFAGSSTNPPTCGNSAPKAVWPFWAKAGVGGTVNLSWGKTENASSWTIAFGVAPHTYIYGLPDFGNGDSRSVQVKSVPRGTYYFAIRANNGCMPGPFSNEWKVVVGGGTPTYVGGQQLGAFVEAAAPEVVAPPVGDNGYTPPTGGINPVVPLPTQPPVIPTPPVKLQWWQSIVDFFNGIRIKY